MPKIIMPDLKFGFFFNEIYPEMIQYKRNNVPELSDENPLEPGNQLIRMFSTGLHYTNCIMDVIASESLLATAQKPDVVRNLLRDVGYEMSPGSPAQAKMVGKLSQTITILPKTILRKYSVFLASNSSTGDVVNFLSKDNFTMNYSNEAITSCVVYEYLNASTWQDFTIDVLSQVTPADDVTPFSSLNRAGDCIYFGHRELMFDALYFKFTTENLNIQGVWEYYDGNFQKAKPDSVIIKTQNIKLIINNYLGTKNKQNTKIKVKCISNNYTETLYSKWDGQYNFVETNSYMLQQNPSDSISSYLIGSDWEELDLIALTPFGKDDTTLSFTLPQSVNESWKKTQINASYPDSYWIRFRLTESIQGTLPVITYVEYSNSTNTYFEFDVRQGRRQTDVMGLSTGSPNQQFKTTKESFIDDGDHILTVDAVEWTRVTDFISSAPNAKHHTISFDKTNTATIVFSDGINGAIPAKGNGNIIFTYNYDVVSDGNVGSRSITTLSGGATYIDSVYNPVSATGWREAEGSTKNSIRIAKINASKFMRINEVALNSDDVEAMALRFSGEDGQSLFSRVFCVSDVDAAAYGPKTLKLIVVMRGGGLASQEQLDEFALYFNGNKFANPPVRSRLVSNQKLFAVNYTPKEIDVRLTVFGSRVNAEEIKTVIKEILNPEAINENNDYIWRVGESVSISKLSYLIHDISDSITKVAFDQATSDITMSTHQLPIAGTITIRVGNV